MKQNRGNKVWVHTALGECGLRPAGLLCVVVVEVVSTAWGLVRNVSSQTPPRHCWMGIELAGMERRNRCFTGWLPGWCCCTVCSVWEDCFKVCRYSHVSGKNFTSLYEIEMIWSILRRNKRRYRDGHKVKILFVYPYPEFFHLYLCSYVKFSVSCSHVLSWFWFCLFIFWKEEYMKEPDEKVGSNSCRGAGSPLWTLFGWSTVDLRGHLSGTCPHPSSFRTQLFLCTTWETLAFGLTRFLLE